MSDKFSTIIFMGFTIPMCIIGYFLLKWIILILTGKRPFQYISAILYACWIVQIVMMAFDRFSFPGRVCSGDFRNFEQMNSYVNLKNNIKFGLIKKTELDTWGLKPDAYLISEGKLLYRLTIIPTYIVISVSVIFFVGPYLYYRYKEYCIYKQIKKIAKSQEACKALLIELQDMIINMNREELEEKAR